MRLVTKADRLVRSVLEKRQRETLQDRVPRVTPMPTPERIQADVELIDSVIFSKGEQ